MKKQSLEYKKVETDIYKETTYNNIQTTKGRILFNECLPKGYIEKFGFVNETINKKMLTEIVKNIYVHFNDQFLTSIYNLQQIGQLYATIFPTTLNLYDTKLPEELKKEREDLYATNDINDYIIKMKNIKKKYETHIKEKNLPINDLIESGAAKGAYDSLLLSKGPVKSITGEIDIINGNLYDGLSPRQYFGTGNSARGGLADRVLNTSHTGYLERKLVYALSPVVLSNDVKDCKTNHTFDIIFDNEFKNRLNGRYYINDKKEMRVINNEELKTFELGQKIKLRSPIFCKNMEICETCYGQLQKKINSRHIGIIAATVLGENGTQSIMRNFHTGGTIGLDNFDIIKAIYQNNIKISKEIITEKFMQKDINLISRDDTVIIIDMSFYEDDELFIDTEQQKINCTLINFKIINKDNLIVDLLSDRSATIDLNSTSYKIEDNHIYIKKARGTILFSVPPEAVIVNFAFMRKILEQTIKSTTIYQQFYRIFNTYNQLGGQDSVHYEVLCSELARDPDELFIPYRMSIMNKQPKIVSIKDLPYLNSPRLGLFFENMQKAIEHGLIWDTKFERKTDPITKLAGFKQKVDKNDDDV